MKEVCLTMCIITAVYILCGCSALGTAMPSADRVKLDTVYISNQEYDSIYIDNWHYTYQKADTVYEEKVKYEYRYRLERDTLVNIRVDSIPYIKKIEVVREARYIPWWCKALSAAGVLFLLFILFKIVKNRAF